MSTKLSITARVPANEAKGTKELGPATITVDTGETAAEMIQMFGDEAVRSQAQGAWVVSLQGAIRSGLKRGEEEAVMQTRLGSAKMGISSKGAQIDPTQAYQAQFLAATPEDQVKMIKQLQQRAAELKKGR